MRDPERDILIHASGLNPDPGKICSLLTREVDVDGLIDAAIREGLAGFLYRSLRKSNSLGSLRPAQEEILESAYYMTVSRNLRLMQDLKEVLHAVNQKNIRVVLLQGMGLLQGVYDDVGLRPMTDVDLWVWKEDYPAMVALLGRLRYERDSFYPTTFRKGSTSFDLQAHILWADRIRARKKLLDIEEEEILAKARSIRVEGEEAFCLSPCDQFLYLGLHLVKHRANRLIWLVDLLTLTAGWAESDWKALVGRAKELGQEKTVAYMLYLLRRIFSFQAPHSMKQAPDPGLLEKRILSQRIKGDALPPWGPAFLYASTKGLIRGLPIFVESLFPRPEILRQIFPESYHRGPSWLYLKRIVQLLGMIGGQQERK